MAATDIESRADLLGLSRSELEEQILPVVGKRFRVEQVYDALHRRAVGEFSEITELAKSLRLELAERFRIGVPEIEERRVSTDGTRKYLLKLRDGASVEAVDIPDRGRHTLCISSQAGCALACRFCVTGFWGAGRSLTAGEIVGQVQAIRRDEPPMGESLNLVFMGMGEPLLNLQNLESAIAVLSEIISLRRITVSTAGVVPGIEALAQWKRRPNLAVSLHAPDDDRRSELMPINRSYPLVELMRVLRNYPLEPRRRITFEYILIRDFNDSLRDADALAKLLRGMSAKVNLIPANPDPVLGDTMVPPLPQVVSAFQQRLLDRGYTTTVRRRRGDDVSAACGQLRAFAREPRGFRRSNLSL
ncbi:MAG: 23S rRNA (adenine(2503)-C(2))-methyltransferase RlmN [Acidobacteriota bacterium]